MKAINLQEKFSLFNDHWSPKIISELNGQQVKLAKIKGEFIWHDHEHEDELFYVLKGEMIMEFRDRKVIVKEGELIVVPKGVEHRPIAHEEVWLMLFEPSETKHTGDVNHELTKEEFPWI